MSHPMFVAAFGREPDLDERLCANCDGHDYEAHVIVGFKIPCSERGCPCRDFLCFEHPFEDTPCDDDDERCRA
jgi:hypothetical protein